MFGNFVNLELCEHFEILGTLEVSKFAKCLGRDLEIVIVRKPKQALRAVRSEAECLFGI